MKDVIPIGTKITRNIGVLFGLFILIGFLSPESEPRDITLFSIYRDVVFGLLSVLLVIPWRIIMNRLLWIVLFVTLVCSAAIFLANMVSSCVWAIGKGDPLQQVMFPLLTIIFAVVIGMQFPAILSIRRHSNQAFKATPSSYTISKTGNTI